MNENTSTSDAHLTADRSAEIFERMLIASFALVLTVTTTFMPKTYVPDRWMIGAWIMFVVGFASALVGYFSGQFGCRRTRLALHALAAVCLVLGLAGTVYFVSEGDDGNDEDQFVLNIPAYVRV